MSRFQRILRWKTLHLHTNLREAAYECESGLLNWLLIVAFEHTVDILGQRLHLEMPSEPHKVISSLLSNPSSLSQIDWRESLHELRTKLSNNVQLRVILAGYINIVYVGQRCHRRVLILVPFSECS